jgi:hypothetical protein
VSAPPGADRGVAVPAWAVALAFTLASALGVNPYAYGIGDDRITIPFLKAFANPRLYAGDYLMEQRRYYYTYLWDALGLLYRSGIRLETLYLATYLLALFGTFLAFYLIGIALFRDRRVAVLSLVFLLLSQTSLAAVNTIEPALNTRGAALPLLLFAILAFLDGKVLRAFALVGIAYLVHPLTTHYYLAMLVVATITRWKWAGLRRLVAPLLAFLAIASPILIWRLTDAPSSLHLLSADPLWLEALRIRSPHHMFPFTWGWRSLVHALASLFLLWVGWHCSDPAADDRHQVTVSFGGTIIVACVAGVVFSEWWPMGINLMLQPARSFAFFDLLAMLYTAKVLYRRAVDGRWLTGLVMLVPIAVWIGSADVDRFRLYLEMSLIGVCCGVAFAFRGDRPEGSRFVVVASLLACLVGATCAVHDRLQDDPEGFSFNNAQEPDWLDVQRWARANTDVHDRFIVPPYDQDEFRVESERSIYVDWEDGGLMNANPTFGAEWLRRLRRIGMFPFCRISKTRIIAIAKQMDLMHRRVFLVWPCLSALDLPLRYSNATYAVYEVVSD